MKTRETHAGVEFACVRFPGLLELIFIILAHVLHDLYCTNTHTRQRW